MTKLKSKNYLCHGVNLNGTKCDKYAYYQDYCIPHFKKYNNIHQNTNISPEWVEKFLEQRALFERLTNDEEKLNYLCEIKEPIYQFNVNTREIIKEFSCIFDIIAENKKFSKLGLYKALNTYKRIHYGFIWAYKKIYEEIGANGVFEPPFVTSLIRHPFLVEQFDYELNTIDINDVQNPTENKIWWKCLKNLSHPSYCTLVVKRTDAKKQNKESTCKECFNDSHRVHNKDEKQKIIDNHVSNGSMIVIGDETEEYVKNILEETNLFSKVERIGFTGDKADIIVTLLNGTKKSLQVKTLSKMNNKGRPTLKDVYCIRNHTEYDGNMLYVLVNKNRDRFALDFSKNLKAICVELRFLSKTSKYKDIMYTDKQKFINKLIELIPLSTDYEGPNLSSDANKEYLSILRLEERCENEEKEFKRNNTNSNSVDCYINNIPVQMKYISLNAEHAYTYELKLAKSSGRINGQQIRGPYSVDDLFEYIIAEVGGTEKEPTKYHGYFCVIPKNALIKKGMLKSKDCKGRMGIMICPPDYEKDHWSKQYWYSKDRPLPF
jgi:hypothetical protein